MTERVLSGAVWRDFSEAVEKLEALVLAADVPARPQDRAEGLEVEGVPAVQVDLEKEDR